ncbi:hypothetical protein [Hydrogenophaga sp. NH-16]|uniref:hypothetical protein n=1 Tax=Hydrogenophaga sp. NH-16 TaxID=2184519 RepID=UPI0019D4A411|nr:hypothetical protein [Hydrogenophaga sp. NH-16]
MNTSTHHMFGALLVRRLPGAARPTLNVERADQGLFLLWLAYMGVLVFAAWLLWRAGAWHRLVEADPTHLTLVIVVLFIGCSLWAGRRAWDLGRQRSALDEGQAHGWSSEFLQGSARPGADRASWLQVLGERAHGPHEMAWWLNGIQLKLGLLGKVIGFSILALQLGQMDSFDPSQSAQLLKSLTGGLGIALLTTVTGLTGNILLGLQLMRLDRFADALVADALALSLTNEGLRDGDRPADS